jgi:hypothetical protein
VVGVGIRRVARRAELKAPAVLIDVLTDGEITHVEQGPLSSHHLTPLHWRHSRIAESEVDEPRNLSQSQAHLRNIDCSRPIFHDAESTIEITGLCAGGGAGAIALHGFPQRGVVSLKEVN